MQRFRTATRLTYNERVTHRESNMEVGGILGFIVLVLDIWAIVRVVQSGASVGAKVLWSLLIIILPVIGLIIWYLAGPK
tara:strand:- start:198931 stop:199167 length:237 start_codon:yes stop_codon:yes gene_type:complete